MKYTILSALLAIIIVSSSFIQDSRSASIKRGSEVYENNCITCHQAKGEGLENTYPPLAKSDYLMKDPKKAIKIILQGQGDEITVNGKKYNLQMPGQDYLSDEQISDVINFISNSWGNIYKAQITPAQVKAAR